NGQGGRQQPSTGPTTLEHPCKTAAEILPNPRSNPRTATSKTEPTCRATPRATRTQRRPLNRCRSCGKDFGGVTAFDRHRVGNHAYEYSHDQPDGRRCLTDPEMKQRGMYLNSSGRWSQPHNGLSERLGSPAQATETPIKASTDAKS